MIEMKGNISFKVKTDTNKQAWIKMHDIISMLEKLDYVTEVSTFGYTERVV